MPEPDWIPYCGAAPLPVDWLTRWNPDPVAIAMLSGFGIWAALSRDTRPTLWIGIGGLALLFVSPLCALSSALFSVRVAHHLALTVFVAPLLVSGLPRLSMPGSPAFWTGLHAAALWAWHAPQPYAWALSSDAGYWLMELTLLGSAVGLWSAVRRATWPTAIAALLATVVQSGLLGALITFASVPLYAPHWLTTFPWGMTPLEDQQLAGILMWAPGALPYLLLALAIGWRKLPPPRSVAA